MNEVPALKLDPFFFVTLLGLGRTLDAAFFDSFIQVVLE